MFFFLKIFIFSLTRVGFLKGPYLNKSQFFIRGKRLLRPKKKTKNTEHFSLQKLTQHTKKTKFCLLFCFQSYRSPWGKKINISRFIQITKRWNTSEENINTARHPASFLLLFLLILFLFLFDFYFHFIKFILINSFLFLFLWMGWCEPTIENLKDPCNAMD